MQSGIGCRKTLEGAGGLILVPIEDSVNGLLRKSDCSALDNPSTKKSLSAFFRGRLWLLLPPGRRTMDVERLDLGKGWGESIGFVDNSPLTFVDAKGLEFNPKRIPRPSWIAKRGGDSS